MSLTAELAGELSADGSQIVLIAGGDDHDLNQTATRLGTLTPLLHPLTDGAGNVLDGNIMLAPATWPMVVQLGHSFRNGHGTWRPGPRLADWMAAEAARRVMPPPPLPAGIVPSGERARDYQLADAAAIAAAGKALVLHDPGLGKTVISILALEARRRAGHQIFPLLVIAPSWEVADVWSRHIRDWAPSWPETVYYRGTGRRALLAGKRGTGCVLLTTYATARRDAALASGPLCLLRPATVIADEAQLIGNDTSHQSQAVQRLASRALQVLLCSGTLIKNSMKNAYPALNALDHRSYSAWKRVRPRYMAIRPGDSGEGEIITGLRPEMEAEFFACLEGQLVRRAKADVLAELPPKIYSVRRPEIPPDWRRAYDTMEADMLAELPDGGELPVMSVRAQLTRLSQLASSAADVTVTWEPDEHTGLPVAHYHVTLRRPSWKAEAVLGILAERPGMPTAVFAESRQLAMITGDYAAEAGLRAGYVVGIGGGITERTRKQAVEDFQAGRLDVIICTAGAGGLGITLTASNCAVMMQRSWELDLATQPEDRVHRIGAEIHDHVEIIDLVTKGTVDQRRRTVLKGKAGQLGQFCRDPRIVRELLGGLR
jgi:SNF2 family DNA or RNA helicase